MASETKHQALPQDTQDNRYKDHLSSYKEKLKDLTATTHKHTKQKQTKHNNGLDNTTEHSEDKFFNLHKS